MTDYFTSDHQPVSSDDLTNLDPDTQVDVMETWFRARYEDPAERTPHDSSEGGYIWIWGGPYEASEVLGHEFSGIIDDDTIDSLVQNLDSECTSWAPTDRPGDDDDDFILDITDFHATFLDALSDIRTLADHPVEDDVAHVFSACSMSMWSRPWRLTFPMPSPTLSLTTLCFSADSSKPRPNSRSRNSYCPTCSPSTARLRKLLKDTFASSSGTTLLVSNQCIATRCMSNFLMPRRFFVPSMCATT